MKVTGLDRELSEVLGTKLFKIPRYQRPFSWKGSSVSDFWADTVTNNDSDYFIGSIVIFKDADSGRYEIVDGQQRLTMLTMMLAGLRNALASEGKKDLAKGVQTTLIERLGLTNKMQFVLDTETSHPFLKDHIQQMGKAQTKGSSTTEERLLSGAFDEITSAIDEELATIRGKGSAKTRDARIERWLTATRDKLLRLKLIEVTVDNDDDAYVIYETLNARGEDLDLVDLVKAHLTRNLKPNNANLDIWKDRWEELRKILSGSRVGINVNTFLHHWWLSQYEYVTERKMYSKFRKTVTKQNAADILTKLLADAKTYREIVEPGYRTWTKQERPVGEALQALEVFRVVQPLPMVLSAMRAYREKHVTLKQLKELLSSIESFHFVVNAVSGRSSSGGISHMYASHARALTDAKTSQLRARTLTQLRTKLRAPARRPSLAEFQAGFEEIRYDDATTTKKRLVQYILRRLDHFHASGAVLNYAEMTIEHVAPQRASGHGGASADHVAKLGNLLLVDEPMNGKLANKSFTEKKKVLAKAKSWVEPALLAKSTWGDAEIDDRTQRLATLAFKKVWG